MNTFDMMQTGKRISNYRKEKNMTQTELADKLNISFQAVSNWERGESMPDISKLPELARILNVSIDDILGSPAQAKIIENVISGKTTDISGNDEINSDDIVKIAPLLKPSQANELFEAYEKELNIEELCSIAPFISQEILDKLAVKASETGDIGKLCSIAPFISQEVIDELAVKASETGDIGKLCSITPFISQEILDELAVKACEKGGIGKLCSIAPFISKEIIDEIAQKAVKF